MAAVFERLGIRTGLDVLRMIDAAEDVVRPAERYRVSGADILLECGNRKLVGGQEDQIIQIAADLAQHRL